MNRRAHSLAFDALMDEWATAGIVREKLAARGINVRPADLSNWSNEDNPYTAPGHVVSALEKMCGKPIVSSAMVASVLGVPAENVSLTLIASEANVAAATATNLLSRADEDKFITHREASECVEAFRRVISQFEQLATEVVHRAETDAQAAQ